MKFASFLIPLLAFATAAHALDARFSAALGKLDPKTRLEQVCDWEAMNKIGQGGSRVDHAISGAVMPAQHVGDMLIVKGGAFRTGGKWYQVAYTCKATPDHKTVLDFTYKTGPAIAPAKWTAYGLYK